MPPLSLNKAEPTLALKPRGDVTRNPKQGYQQVRIQDLCKGAAKQDFADIVQQSRGNGKNLGLKIGGRGPGPLGPPI